MWLLRWVHQFTLCFCKFLTVLQRCLFSNIFHATFVAFLVFHICASCPKDQRGDELVAKNSLLTFIKIIFCTCCLETFFIFRLSPWIWPDLALFGSIHKDVWTKLYWSLAVVELFTTHVIDLHQFLYNNVYIIAWKSFRCRRIDSFLVSSTVLIYKDLYYQAVSNVEE